MEWILVLPALYVFYGLFILLIVLFVMFMVAVMLSALFALVMLVASFVPVPTAMVYSDSGDRNTRGGSCGQFWSR
ncbi:hypothetical protein BC830DRAFT_1158282 [Chytriomyces sp. MP71]|nr:hypothetical protein BC830DRAFT_1158282 [Chytriomyces sp. MP71]